MKKCSPVEMRKNLEVVELLKSQGIDFVAIPVGGKLTKEVFDSVNGKPVRRARKE